MKNLTIKMKLIISFAVVAILVLILAIYSILSISKTTDGFTNYREMAKDAVLASRVQANMLMVRLNVKDYIKTGSQKDIDEFNYYYERADKFMQEALKEIQKPTRAPLVDKLSQDLIVYKQKFGEVTSLMAKRNELVNNNFKVNGVKIEQLLISIMNTAAADKDMQASLAVSQGLQTALLARLYTSRYLLFNTKVDHDRVIKEFDTLSEQLIEIEKNIDNPTRKRQLNEAIGYITAYRDGIYEIETIISTRNDIINNGLNMIGPKIAQIAEDVKLSIKKDQDEIGPEVKRLNENINRVILVISIIILLLVIILGIIIPRNISQLIGTFQKGLLNFFKYLNKQSDTVEIIEIHSNDEIGQMSKAVNKGIRKVEEIMTKTNNEAWIKNGVNDLNEILSKSKSVEEVCHESIQFICKYLNAGVGVLYRYRGSIDKLVQYGSYAHVVRDELSNEFNIGEGVIGQVALQKEPILLKNIKKGEAVITTGTLTQDAYNSYTYPLIYNDELFGVIEIGSFEEISQKQMDFFEVVNRIVCIALATALQNKRVQNLLDETKQSNDELELRQHKLEEANTYMEEQQQQLEEANANMEEQQQQLEEANANMEEQQQQLKISEQNLKLQNQQLEDTKKDIQRKAEELTQSSKYKSEFLANMSHELRTPLNSIILLSSLLQRNSKATLNEDDIKKARTIFDSGNELLRLINDILDLSKVESGKMHVIVDKFKSGTLLQQMKDSFDYTATDKGLKFQIVDEYNEFILSDKDRIGQIIRNLVSNAFKFTKEGSITLKITPSKLQDCNVQISVIDTGIGIPKEKQELIFKAFTQADGSTSREFGGTGLGLSISRELAKLLQGYISLESKENEGSSFSIDLPNLNMDDLKEINHTEKQEEQPEQPKTSSANKQLTSNETVNDDRDIISTTDEVYLVIDDDKTFAQVVYEEIKNSDQFGLIALDATSGLELVKKYNIKGIMLDLTLPDMDGMDVLRELKSNANTRHIPVHIISSKDKDTQTLEMGAIGYLQKPAMDHDISDVLTSFDSFSSKKIKDLLIVEDNKVHREALIELIGEGVNIKGVNSAQEAINEVKKEKYDTVVVDLGLIDSNGYEVCEYIKNSHPKLPIIIYTGKELSQEEKVKLQEYSNSIIIKTANSNERILNEINIFLHRDEIEEASSQDELFENVDLEDVDILIVDDDIKNIFVLDAALKEFNATTHTAFNGKEALEFLESNKDVDIILMDIMMPIMNGYEAIEHIRNDESIKDIPIIAVTAKAMKEDREKCIQLGANDYMAKPINLNVLGKMIKAWSNKK